MTGGASLQSLLTEKRFDLVETVFQEALADPLLNEETILAALRGFARAGPEAAPAGPRGRGGRGPEEVQGPPDAPRLRWTILKEAVRAGATPSTPDGFHRLFEDVLASAWPDAVSLTSLLGRFKFREAKDPLDGLARAEKAEAWLPFETGKVFAMAGRGAGKVVETNFALNVVRLDFESAKGVAVPIGIASRQLVSLPPGHFLNEKFTAPDALRERVVADPGAALKHLIDSFGRALTMTEVKEAVKGLVAEESWTSWWTASKKNPQVVVHGSGKNATVEWSDSADAADATLLAKFERSALKDRIDLFRKNQKRSADLALSMAKLLVADAEELEDRDAATAFEIAVLVEKVPGVTHAADVERHVLAQPLALLGRLSDRTIRERALEILVREKPAEAPAVLAEWLFKEEDAPHDRAHRPEARGDRLRDARADARQAPQEPALGTARLRVVRAALRDGRRVPGAPQPERPRPAPRRDLVGRAGRPAHEGPRDVRPHRPRRGLARQAGLGGGGAARSSPGSRATTSSSRFAGTACSRPPRCASRTSARLRTTRSS